MKSKLFIFTSSLCFSMVGYLTARAIYEETDVPYFKLLMYTMFGIFYIYQYTNEIKKQ